MLRLRVMLGLRLGLGLETRANARDLVSPFESTALTLAAALSKSLVVSSAAFSSLLTHARCRGVLPLSSGRFTSCSESGGEMSSGV